MKTNFVIKFLPLLLLAAVSCKENGTNNSAEGENSFLGGNKVIRIAEVTKPSSIFPHQLTNVVEGLIASQIHEGLTKINSKDLSVMPGLAEKWEIAPDGKSITFHLRKGIKFQESNTIKGTATEIKASDVQFTFELLCTSRDKNVHFPTVCKDRVVGAQDFYDGKTKSLNGFKVIDDYTFKIELLNSPTIFLEILSNPFAAILSKKAYEIRKDSCVVGAGPFVLDEKGSTDTHYALYKNVNYYRKDNSGNALPLVDSVVIDIMPNTETALIKFKEGKYDFIGAVPSSQLKDIVEENIKEFKGNPPRFILDQRPEMITAYYSFNINKVPFNNVKVRQAFNYAVDRNRIIDNVLYGQAFGPATHGLVPPTFSFYDINSVKGYSLNVEKAKKLLAEAGYPDGKGFPEVQLLINNAISRNASVAAEIQKQLKNNLNVNVTFESIQNHEKTLLAIKGKGDMYREGWIADYPSPESFLMVYFGESVNKADTSLLAFPNTIKYVNPNYNKMYKKGRDAVSKDSSAFYFLKAEQILMDDAAIMPLWYESNCRLITTRMKNFYSNPLRYFDLSQVSLQEKK